MAKCKMNNCREEALPFGKRYCAHHKAEYLRKQAEYERIGATLRKCDGCGERLTKTRSDNGSLCCAECGDKRRKARLEYLAEKEASERAAEKLELLIAATDVADLKAWMVRYLLLQ